MNQNRISEGAVRDTLNRWRSAWENRDLAAYSELYSPRFVGRNYSRRTGFREMSRDEWLRDKRTKFTQAGYVSVELEDLALTMQGRTALVTFVQRYRSGKYADVGRKTLRLEEENGDLRIVQEDFTPITGGL